MSCARIPLAIVLALANRGAFAIAAGRDDAVTMLQSAFFKPAGHGLEHWKFAVGDHVLVSLEDSASPVKASVTARDEAEGTYSVHLWAGPPRERQRLHVPTASMADAGPQERADAERASQALQEEAVLAEESRAQREQQQYDEQLASEEAEAAKREAKAYAKAHADVFRLQAEREALAMQREEAKRRHRLEVERKARREAEEAANTHVKLTVKGRHGKTAEFTLPRRAPFEEVLAEACRRFGLEPSRASFFYEREEINADDTADKLQMGAAADIVMGLRRQQE